MLSLFPLLPFLNFSSSSTTTLNPDVLLDVINIPVLSVLSFMLFLKLKPLTVKTIVIHMLSSAALPELFSFATKQNSG